MINLLPPHIKRDRAYTRRNSLLIKYMLVTLAITALAVTTLLAGNYLLKREETQLEEQIEQKQQEVAAATKTATEARDLAEQIDTVGRLLQDEVKFSKLLPAIAGLVPEQAQLTNLTLTADTATPLILVATTNNQSTAAIMRANIEDSKLFTAADIISISPGTETGKSIVTIQALFTKDISL